MTNVIIHYYMDILIVRSYNILWFVRSTQWGVGRTVDLFRFRFWVDQWGNYLYWFYNDDVFFFVKHIKTLLGTTRGGYKIVYVTIIGTTIINYYRHDYNEDNCIQIYNNEVIAYELITLKIMKSSSRLYVMLSKWQYQFTKYA